MIFASFGAVKVKSLISNFFMLFIFIFPTAISPRAERAVILLIITPDFADRVKLNFSNDIPPTLSKILEILAEGVN